MFPILVPPIYIVHRFLRADPTSDFPEDPLANGGAFGLAFFLYLLSKSSVYIIFTIKLNESCFL